MPSRPTRCKSVEFVSRRADVCSGRPGYTLRADARRYPPLTTRSRELCARPAPCDTGAAAALGLEVARQS